MIIDLLSTQNIDKGKSFRDLYYQNFMNHSAYARCLDRGMDMTIEIFVPKDPSSPRVPCVAL